VLRGLVDGGIEVPVVITQPDRPAGRRRRPTAPPIVAVAHALGIPCLQPERIDDALPDLGELAPTVGVVCAYGQLLPARVLALCPWLNLHPSVLPRWRGAAPIERALMAGDRQGGVAVMRTVEALDAGPLAAVREFPIGADEDAGTLAARALEYGIPLLIDAIRAAAEERLVLAPQSTDGVTYAAKITREDRLLDPVGMSARVAYDRVRSLRPDYGALIALDEEPVTVWRCEVVETSLPPGTVAVDGATVTVGFAGGGLRIQELQSPGRRPLAVADWLRGIRRPPMRAARAA
jgi:methionyl-tRNA formyltransferase